MNLSLGNSCSGGVPSNRFGHAVAAESASRPGTRYPNLLPHHGEAYVNERIREQFIAALTAIALNLTSLLVPTWYGLGGAETLHKGTQSIYALVKGVGDTYRRGQLNSAQMPAPLQKFPSP